MQTFDLYTWVILPLIIFLARFVDVSLGTLRIIFVSRGRKVLAPLLGFIEVLIWITIVSEVVRGTQSALTYLAYAAGFAVGNYAGMMIEERLAIGTLVVRVILTGQESALVERLSAAGYGATLVQGQGVSGPVTLIYTVVLRKELPQVARLIQDVHPKAFLTVEELRSVQQGIFPGRAASSPLDRFFGRKTK